jgi:hypothetical protein
MSLIIPANTLASGGFAVDNSCRFDGTADYLNRTQGTSTNLTKFAWSGWIKRSKLAADQVVTMNYASASNYGYFYFRNTDDLRIFDRGAGGDTVAISDMLFRDTSAWYHIALIIDTTQATDTNRLKLYVNGILQGLNGVTYPAENAALGWKVANTSNTFLMKTESADNYVGGYLAQATYIDGTANAITDFGEFDSDSNIWKPIDVSGLTFGDEGYCVNFEDSAALGDDVSGNGNDFTVNNLTAIDQTTDTPTNNFCTLNPLVYSTGLTFSEGNCKLVTAGSSTSGGVGTMGMPSGKWYYEVKLGSDIDNHTHGIISEFTNTNQSALQNKVGVTSWINGDGGEVVVDGSATTADYGLYTINQIMGIAVDVDNSTISYYRDGSALVTGFTISTTRGTLFPLICQGINTTAEVNFGNPTFTISSGNTDGNGYGNFEYAPPSGFLSLCTANLSEVLG